MDDLDYLDAYREDDPIPERYDNGNLGGIISTLIAWIAFFAIIVIICTIVGGLL